MAVYNKPIVLKNIEAKEEAIREKENKPKIIKATTEVEAVTEEEPETEIILNDVVDKLEEAKYLMSLETLSKSGKNDFQKFQYLELSDFLPQARRIFRKLNLATTFQINFKKNIARLIVKDKESETKQTFSIAIDDVTEKNPGKSMQTRGTLQTYAMRYLYFQLFELNVPDGIDSKNNQTTRKTSKSTPTNNKETTKQTSNVPDDFKFIPLSKIDSESIKDIEYAINWCEYDITSKNFSANAKRMMSRVSKLVKANKLDKSIISNVEKEIKERYD